MEALKKVLDNLIIDHKEEMYLSNFKNTIINIASYQSKGQFKNQWIWEKPLEYFIQTIYDLDRIGLELDGKHITLTNRGLTFDYIAYVNKLTKLFPNNHLDIDLVYNDDEFSIRKESGKVYYKHNIGNPFNKKRENLSGGYCVLKIPNVGEFQTVLSIDELQKHESLSNMKYLYNDWWRELYKKTIIRKVLKIHFEKDFDEMNEIDNEHSTLQKLEYKKEVNIISEDKLSELLSTTTTEDELKELWKSLNEDEQVKYKERFTKKRKEI